MSNFDIFVISGGLGNQLFQIATASDFALKRKKKVYLDTTTFYKNKKLKFECSELIEDLNKKEIQLKINIPLIFSFLVKIRKILDNKYIKFFLDSLIQKVHEIEPYKYQNFIKKKSFITIFVGSWQSEKYFANINEIFSHTLTSLLKKYNYSFDKNIPNKAKKIAVHFRLGDYRYTKGYGIIELSYYSNAIKYLRSRFKNCFVIIFSDEIEFLKDKKIDANYFFDDNNMNSIEVLACMSSCDHFVTANSSYSWWAAYLGENSKKIVITPKNWFVDRSSIPDLIPDKWIIMNNKLIK